MLHIYVLLFCNMHCGKTTKQVGYRKAVTYSVQLPVQKKKKEQKFYRAGISLMSRCIPQYDPSWHFWCFFGSKNCLQILLWSLWYEHLDNLQCDTGPCADNWNCCFMLLCLLLSCSHKHQSLWKSCCFCQPAIHLCLKDGIIWSKMLKAVGQGQLCLGNNSKATYKNIWADAILIFHLNICIQIKYIRIIKMT